MKAECCSKSQLSQWLLVQSINSTIREEKMNHFVIRIRFCPAYRNHGSNHISDSASHILDTVPKTMRTLRSADWCGGCTSSKQCGRPDSNLINASLEVDKKTRCIVAHTAIFQKRGPIRNREYTESVISHRKSNYGSLSCFSSSCQRPVVLGLCCAEQLRGFFSISLTNVKKILPNE